MMGDIVIVCHELQYGTAHSSFFDTVFYGDDMLEVESYLVQQWLRLSGLRKRRS